MSLNVISYYSHLQTSIITFTYYRLSLSGFLLTLPLLVRISIGPPTPSFTMNTFSLVSLWSLSFVIVVSFADANDSQFSSSISVSDYSPLSVISVSSSLRLSISLLYSSNPLLLLLLSSSVSPSEPVSDSTGNSLFCD